MRITVRGIVQGVGFRPTVHRVATQLGMHGYVQNNGSNVVIEVDGDADLFVSELRRALPPLARLDSVEISPGMPDAELSGMGFQIVKSSSGQKGVGIPNDTAICDNCQREMFDTGRQKISLSVHQLHRLRGAVLDHQGPALRPGAHLHGQVPDVPRLPPRVRGPDGRRFHHQTISCPLCGPRFRLLDGDGKAVAGEPIATFAAMLGQGLIGVAKGWGGMHLCCTLSTLPRMRQWYRRREKPFAIMVRDMDAVKKVRSAGPA